MKIQKLIITGFCIIVILLIILGSYAISTISSLSLEMANIYNHSFAVSQSFNNINIRIESIHRNTKDVVLSENEEQLSMAVEQIAINEKIVHDEFEIVFDRFIGNKADLNKIYQNFVDWEKMHKEIIFLVKNDKVEQAIAITRSKGARQATLLNDVTRKLIHFTENKAERFYKKAMKHEKDSLYIVVILLVSVVVISITIWKTEHTSYSPGLMPSGRTATREIKLHGISYKKEIQKSLSIL
jgi:hypothetical protein